jgi:hypothetical protein
MPAINKPNQHFDVLTWSGTGGGSGATRSITGLNFQPDFIWEKARTSGIGHQLLDSVRGVGQNKVLASNSTGDEPEAPNTESLYGWMSAINSDGFTLTNGTSTFDNWNKSADDYVAWNWKAGGAAVANTAGSIASQVSVNSTAGFSIVTYTSPNTSVDETVGHGLNATPQFIITKNRDASWNWDIYHKNLSSGYGLVFASDSEGAGRWPTTTPTNSVFSVKYNYEHISTNRFVAYCWTPIAGYSAFGRYTGNGVTNGPFVYTGFRPRLIMIKNITFGGVTTSDWFIRDTARDTYNVANKHLWADVATTESNASYAASQYENLDILSNGFKLRNDNGGTNRSGDTMIYAAFAENPFKFSNGR